MTELQKLRKKVQDHNLRVAEIQGEKKALLKELKKDYDLPDLKAAKTHLRKMARKISQLGESVEKAKAAFVQAYGDELGID